jgi:uncharacterized membrane protein
LLIAVLLGIGAGMVAPDSWRLVTRLLIGWNTGVWLYLTTIGLMLWQGSSHEWILRHARRQDEGRLVILVLACVAAMVSIGAIVAQLAATKDMSGLNKHLHIGLAAATILGAFAFIHLSFALHYAHEYVTECHLRADGSPRGGLAFPGTSTPDYGDFLYFAFVIGVAGQTADVSITSSAMRRVALLHCILSFFFNTTVLALTINIAAGLI